jgi:hypothetical protein
MAKATTHVQFTKGPDGKPRFDDDIFAMMDAYAVLHDLEHGGPPDWLSASKKAVRKAKREEIYIGEPAVRHLRYWRPDGSVTFSDDRILAGGYVNTERKVALIAVLNPTEEEITTTVEFADKLLGQKPASIQEILTDTAVGEGREAELELKPHGVKMLLVK